MEKMLRKPLPTTVEKKDRVLDKYDRKELHILFSVCDTPWRFRNEAFRVAAKKGQEAAKNYIRSVGVKSDDEEFRRKAVKVLSESGLDPSFLVFIK